MVLPQLWFTQKHQETFSLSLSSLNVKVHIIECNQYSPTDHQIRHLSKTRYRTCLRNALLMMAMQWVYRATPTQQTSSTSSVSSANIRHGNHQVAASRHCNSSPVGNIFSIPLLLPFSHSTDFRLTSQHSHPRAASDSIETAVLAASSLDLPSSSVRQFLLVRWESLALWPSVSNSSSAKSSRPNLTCCFGIPKLSIPNMPLGAYATFCVIPKREQRLGQRGSGGYSFPRP